MPGVWVPRAACGRHGVWSTVDGDGVAVTGAMVFLAGFGLVTAAFPRLWWQLSRWQYRNPDAVEPSNAAFAVGRVAGLAVAGLGLFLGRSVEAQERDQDRREAHRAEVAADPEAVVHRYAHQVLKEARRSATPPRQLTGAVLRSVAERVGDVTADPAVDGQPSVSSGSCRLPVEVQRTQVQGLAATVMGRARARARGITPRDEKLLREMAGTYAPGRFTVARPQGLEVRFAPDFP